VQRVAAVLVADADRADAVLPDQGLDVGHGVAHAGLEERLVDEALLLVDVVALGLLGAQDLRDVQLDLPDDTVDVDEQANIAVAVLRLQEAVVHLEHKEVAAAGAQLLLADPHQRVVELVDSCVDERRPHHVGEAGRVVPVLGQHLGAGARPALERGQDGLAARALRDALDLPHELHVVPTDRGVEHVQAHDLEAHVLPRPA